MDQLKLSTKPTLTFQQEQLKLNKLIKPNTRPQTANHIYTKVSSSYSGALPTRESLAGKPQGAYKVIGNQLVHSKTSTDSIVKAIQQAIGTEFEKNERKICRNSCSQANRNKSKPISDLPPIKALNGLTDGNQIKVASNIKKSKSNKGNDLPNRGVVVVNQQHMSEDPSIYKARRAVKFIVEDDDDLSECLQKKAKNGGSHERDYYTQFIESLASEKKRLTCSDEQASKLHHLLARGDENNKISSNKNSCPGFDFGAKISQAKSLGAGEADFVNYKEEGDKETPSHFGTDFIIPDLQFCSQSLSNSTRANSSEFFETDSVSLGCDGESVITTPKFLKTSERELSVTMGSDSELGCEELFDLKLLEIGVRKALTTFSSHKQEKSSNIAPQSLEQWAESINKDSLREYHLDFLKTIQMSEAHYKGDPCYLNSKQTEITANMRAVLIDWMIEASSDFGLKRDTLHIAVTFLNKYLSTVADTPSWKLQLVGVTSLLLACKTEEIHVPKIKDFAGSTDDGYTQEQIRKMELEMCKVLQWRLNPTTAYTVVNYLMTCWDKFMDSLFEASGRGELDLSGFDQSGMYFKQPNTKSYAAFRKVTQLLDLIQLNIKTLSYDIKSLAASIIYIVIGEACQQVTQEEIVARNFSSKSNKNRRFNKIFDAFLEEYSLPRLDDLLPSIEYISPCFGVSFCFEPPKTIKEHSRLRLDEHYEEFLSFQTHSQSNLSFIKEIL